MPVKLYTIGVYLLLCLECHCPLFLLTWQVNSPGLHILHSSKGTGLSSCSHPHYTVDICVLIRKFLGEETFLSSSLSSCLLMDECSVVLRSPRQKSNKLSRLLPFYIGVLLPFLEWFFFFFNVNQLTVGAGHQAILGRGAGHSWEDQMRLLDLKWWDSVCDWLSLITSSSCSLMGIACVLC